MDANGKKTRTTWNKNKAVAFNKLKAKVQKTLLSHEEIIDDMRDQFGGGTEIRVANAVGNRHLEKSFNGLPFAQNPSHHF